MLKNKLILSLCIIVAAFLVVTQLKGQTQAWFGAGKTPGWPATTTGLAGEIPLPSYKFAPDFYRVGDTVSPQVTGFNLTGKSVTSHYFLAVDRVIESPIGVNITNGTPTTPGINENDLNTNHKNGNDVQSQVALIDLGSFTFPAHGQTTFSASYKTTETGYYQFDFIDIDPAEYQPGHILAAGYFRVLPPLVTPSPTPSPSVSPSPSTKPEPSPSPTPTPTTDNQGQKTQLGITGPICNNRQFRAYANVTNNGQPISGINISFNYNNQTLQSLTDNKGQTGVNFTYGGNTKVEMNPDQGYPSQSQLITLDDSTACQTLQKSQNSNSQSTGSILGSTTVSTSGQVLGASTMAETGVFEDNLVNMVGLMGAALLATGAVVYAKKSV